MIIDFDTLVIDLEDNPYIRNRDAYCKSDNGYYMIFDAHAHPVCFEIIKPDPASVPQKISDDYGYALPILKRIEDEISKESRK